ncbi:MAG: FG-GAP-like repeat-containing protein [Ignavibacteriaceae bacterium]|nr:FG-GAP-like repeat-containing protein [Ignavibacteriaceae bacterium]
MVAKITLVLILFVLNTYPQQFTKILTGAPVNDAGESFGVAWVDLNNDGLPDLIVSNGGAAGVKQRNFVYMNNGNGTFTKVTSGDIIQDSSISNGATIADYDNDGFPDVFIANRNLENNFLFKNINGTSFQKITTGSIANDGGETNDACWVDYNNDGFVDLYAVNFMGKRFLYKNNGNGTFTKIDTGLVVTESTTSITCSFGDYDNDNLPDLFIANPNLGNELFHNEGNGYFRKITSDPVVDNIGVSMSGTWGDYDNDGYLDLFVANQQGTKNFLYHNERNGTFRKITTGDIVNDISWGISGSWVDYDNDGYLDLFVANFNGNKNFLYHNDGPPNYTFTKITTGDIVNDVGNSMAAAWADFDNDGYPDLFVANRGNLNNFLYKNNNSGNNWVNFTCIGTTSNKSAIGTKVRIKAKLNGLDTWQLREINSQHGYNSENDLRVSFGIANAAVIDSVLVQWPSGKVDVFTNIIPNKFYKIIEGSGIQIITGIKNNPGIKPLGFNIQQNYPNPFNPSTTIKYSIPSGNNVRIIVNDIMGRQISLLVNEFKSPGEYSVVFNSGSIPSGIYFYSLISGSMRMTKKMIIIK